MKKNMLAAAIQATRLSKWLCTPCGHCNTKTATCTKCGHNPLKRA